jgi:hypothetical protein
VRALGALPVLLMIGTACTPQTIACTEIAAPSGISVTVARNAASSITKLILTVCPGGRCRDHVVELTPGSDSVDAGCDGQGPDAACSATAVPNGTQVGFVEIADLPVGRVAVGATLTSKAGIRRYDRIRVQVDETYPNGPSCPAGRNQGRISVERDFLR